MVTGDGSQISEIAKSSNSRMMGMTLATCLDQGNSDEGITDTMGHNDL